MCIRDRYYDEMWRKREIKIFDISRGCEELVDILHVERMEKIKDLPYDETEVAGVAGDDDDLVTYLIVTNNPLE